MEKELRDKLLTTNKFKPLITFEINDSFLLGVYQGSLSRYDLLIKFRQKEKDISKKRKWTYLRTPKHIHWTVDLLIKMSHYPELTREFLDFLISIWNNTVPNITDTQRDEALLLDNFIRDNVSNIEKYYTLNTKGEYSVNFLIVLAKLLIQQEKNNKADAYMFINLLKELKKGTDIFSIVSRSTHNGR